MKKNFSLLKSLQTGYDIRGDGSGGGKWSQRAGGRTVFAEKDFLFGYRQNGILAIERHTDRKLTGLEDILKADRNAREFVLREAD